LSQLGTQSVKSLQIDPTLLRPILSVCTRIPIS
jgi:hypothetical protein